MSGDIRVVKGETSDVSELPDFLANKSEKFQRFYALFKDLLETEGVNQILHDFNAMVGTSLAIIDEDANVLASSNWQKLCTDFHRVNPDTCQRCIESDTELANNLEQGKKFTIYGCKNGLVDCASPIIIEGEHVANLFIGQFLIKKPDQSFFEKQATDFGFPLNEYMKALGDVPVVEETRIPAIMDFLVHFANLVAAMGLEKLRSVEIEEKARQNLEVQVEERTRELQEAEERSRLLLNSVGEGVFGVDLEGRITFVNPQAARMLGYKPDEITGRRAHALFHHTRPDGSHYPVEECWMFKSFTFGESYRIDDEILWRKDGTSFEIEYHSTPVHRDDELVGAVISFIDISLRKEAERKLRDAYSVITGSINYASRIQRSILPHESVMERSFQDRFVIWRPRDIVGGDMYWCCEWSDGLLIMLGDGTGHGVPGAFMTLIVNGAFEMASLEVPPGQVEALVQRMHTIVQLSLGQNFENGKSDEGMDLGVCFVPADRSKLVFVGANFELFISEDGEVRSIKGTRKGIGYRSIPAHQSYETFEVELNRNQTFYMTSDGLIDQIGGPRHRGFGKKRFKKTISGLRNLTLSEQEKDLRQALNDYKGEERQRDDISVIGFRL